MDKSRGATGTVMEETRTEAEDYYRRAGFNSLTVRTRPGIWRRANHIQVRLQETKIGDVMEAIIYPELMLRENPWQFWGKVVDFNGDSVLFVEIGKENAELDGDNFIRIPYRYFDDGRVYRTEGYLE